MYCLSLGADFGIFYIGLQLLLFIEHAGWLYKPTKQWHALLQESKPQNRGFNIFFVEKTRHDSLVESEI